MHLSFSRRIGAPPAVLWELLTHLDAWPLWGPTVLGGELDDGRRHLDSGATGRVRVPPGVRLPFEVTEWVAGERWAWRVAGVPATAHRVVAHPKGCRVTFEVPWWAPAYGAVCIAALVRLERLAAEQ